MAMTQGKILWAIEALQATMQYADEVEWICLAAKIDRLLELLEKAPMPERAGMEL